METKLPALGRLFENKLIERERDILASLLERAAVILEPPRITLRRQTHQELELGRKKKRTLLSNRRLSGACGSGEAAKTALRTEVSNALLPLLQVTSITCITSPKSFWRMLTVQSTLSLVPGGSRHFAPTR